MFTQFGRPVDGVAVPELGIGSLADFEAQTQRKENFKALLGRVDVNLSPSQRLTVRANFSDNDGRNTFGFPGTVINVSPEGFEDFTNEALSVVASLTSIMGTQTFNELKYHFVRETRPRELKSETISFDIFDTGQFRRCVFLAHQLDARATSDHG